MSGDDPQGGRHREKSGRHHWHSLKGKLFTNDEKGQKDGGTKFQLNDDVMDFLQPTANKAAPHQSSANPTPQLSPIDTSSAPRWPTASEINQLSVKTLHPSHSRHSSRGRSASPKLNKHLHVTFTEEQPEIIGEGGDEAESPPREISRRRTKSLSPTQERATTPAELAARARSSKELDRKPVPGSGSPSRAPGRPFVNNGELPPIPPPKLAIREQERIPVNFGRGGRSGDDANSFQPPPLPRRGIGFSQIPGGPEGARVMAENGEDQARSYDVNTQNREREEAGHPLSFAARIQAKMRAEEGRALHQGIRDPSPERQGDFLPQNSGAPHHDRNDSLRSTSSPQTPPHRLVPTQLLPGYPSNSPTSGIEGGMQAVSLDRSTKPPQFSMQPATNSVADDALQDFSFRVQPMGTLFHLAAEASKPIMETPFAEWIKAATWWFLKGRAELETAIRNRPVPSEEHEGHSAPPPKPYQAYVDLAKAWWVVKYIAPSSQELAHYGNSDLAVLLNIVKTQGDEKLIALMEMHQAIVANLRSLAASMKKNNFLPPTPDESPLPPGIDTSIWIKYPAFTADISGLLSGNVTQSMLLQTPKQAQSLAETMPISDTKQAFCYGRMFVEVLVADEGSDSPDIRLPCVLSIVRDRTKWHPEVVVSSQNELVNIRVQSSKQKGPTWEDVRWRARQNVMLVKLPRGFSLNVYFTEKDFNNLWGIWDYSNRMEESMQPTVNEDVLIESTVKAFQYIDSDPNSRVFPKESTKRSPVKLFEQKKTWAEGTGTRTQHRGYRFVAMTNPKTKISSSISHDLGKDNVIAFSFLRGDEGDPALLLKVSNDKKECSMILTFQDEAERTVFYALLTGVNLKNDEVVVVDIPLKGFYIEQLSQAGGFSQSARDVLGKMEWQRLWIINKDPEDPGHEHTKTVLSKDLRLCADSTSGRVTDRVNLGPGQLQFALSISTPFEARVLRPTQEDMTLAVIENKASKESEKHLQELLTAIRATNTVRTYLFHTLKDLHSFQAAITGFSVQFDGVASSFAISRRRMVVPIYKKWEANTCRLQILKQDRVVQLVAFFQDFSHGECMNLHLKGTDVYESLNKSGKFCIRIVDAKFALPKDERAENKAFVTLDLPEYPGEHDDITISFDTVGERDKFQEALPAEVTKPSRMTSLRK